MENRVWRVACSYGKKNGMCQEQESNPRFPIIIEMCYHYTILTVDLGSF